MPSIAAETMTGTEVAQATLDWRRNDTMPAYSVSRGRRVAQSGDQRGLRVLIAVGEPLLAQGMRSILEASEEIQVTVSELSDVASLLEWLTVNPMDVCVLGLDLPSEQLDTGSMIAQARARCGDCSILLFTQQPDLAVMLSAFDVGAAGVLAREDEVDLLAAVRAAGGGLTVVTGYALKALLTSLGAPPVGSVGGADELTAREREVLRWLAAGKSNTEIAEQLTVSARTVKTHVSHIFAKLGVRDRAQAVIAAYASGVAHPPPADRGRS